MFFGESPNGVGHLLVVLTGHRRLDHAPGDPGGHHLLGGVLGRGTHHRRIHRWSTPAHGGVAAHHRGVHRGTRRGALGRQAAATLVGTRHDVDGPARHDVEGVGLLLFGQGLLDHRQRLLHRRDLLLEGLGFLVEQTGQGVIGLLEVVRGGSATTSAVMVCLSQILLGARIP